MKKVFLLLTVVILSAVVLTACSGIDTNGVFANDGEPLVGSWDWEGSPFYTFNANGTGNMAGSAIRWAGGNGELSVCLTPGICGTSCPAPIVWNFSFSNSNNTLDLSGNGEAYTYTRR
ncbi:MAG: hypothetical protein FWE05_00765 [Defluviitaleaceae bacterium]|nr:hypothetical protein [Defluviitaleaceae bacterium]